MINLSTYGVRNLKEKTNVPSSAYYQKQLTPEFLLEKLTGRGLQLSPMFDAGGNTLTNIGIANVSQSLFVILSTPIGTRFFNPNFGTKLYEYIFEPNDDVLKDLVKSCVTDEITLWEPRIDFEVNVQSSEDRVNISIIYNLKGNTTKYSYVFPVNKDIHILGSD